MSRIGYFVTEPADRIFVWQHGDDTMPMSGTWIDYQDPMNPGEEYVRPCTYSDLYEALKELLRVGGQATQTERADAFKKARAALAKHEGRQ